MATVSPSSISKAGLIPGAAFTVKKNDYSFKCCFWRKAGQKHYIPSSSQTLVLPLSTSLKLFPTHGRQLVLNPHRSRAATGTDVVATVEEQDSPPPPVANDAAPTTISQSRGTSRPGRKSEMPSIKNEELVAGATFTGKVRAIQPFGAFVDFGAFTDGLVHVSQLSDTFVKDVASVVTIGQEVKVRLVEVDIESKRISLTMRENDDPPKRQPGGGGGSDSKPRGGGKRNASKEDGFSSKYVKGQMLDGTVKNLTRSGAFITIGEGEEGFLPTNEEADDGIGSMMMGGGSSLQAGQEVKVRVLRIARGRVTLTMKEEDDGKFDETLSQGVVHTATNPFVLAFRKNEEIAAFLDKREEEAEEKPVEPVTVTVSESEEAVVSEETSEEVVSSETPKIEEVIETKAQDASQESTLGAAAEVEEVEKIEETSDAPSVPETKNEEEVA
ncbi:30S ribosomal protein S1 [Brassica rapa]|uniref:30S ribosomal protein S1 n=1 Tax=Brassica campestris TaxID=3711 RepID=UPI0004F1ABFE|nr:30S ribosomal protein S1 [Brassica rapa]